MNASTEELKQAIQYYNAASMSIEIDRNYEKAIDYYYMALDELHEKKMQDHKLSVIVLESIADAYAYLDDPRALQCYVSALQTAIRVYGESEECAKISIKVAEAFEKAEQPQEAFNCLCKSYEVLIEKYGENSVEAKDVLDKIFQLRNRMKQP